MDTFAHTMLRMEDIQVQIFNFRSSRHPEPNSSNGCNQPTTQWYSPGKGGNKDETHIIVHTFICLFNHREELGVLPFGDTS